jgi:GntR family transcriptional regulator/MocR family aminotransferase
MTFLKGDPFSPALDRPLYQQLYAHMRAAILSGQLKGGLKLPSTRALAGELNVSRNTVLSAYEQLIAEGYLESVEGSGTFVARALPEQYLAAPARRRAAHVPAAKRDPLPLSRHAALQLEAARSPGVLPPAELDAPRPFRGGIPALDAFPLKLWSRLLVRHARPISSRSLSYQGAAGYRPLREAIATYTVVSRGVRCTPDQVIVVNGFQGALDLSARALLNAGDEVWMEDPGYPSARVSLLGVGARIVAVPIDGEGLQVSEGMARAPQARLAYVTPAHQFPLGVTLSLARRLKLLEWARHSGAYIAEDDYDSEYRFTGHPLAALQGLDEAERVLYIGTFSKVLFPALRLGYLIVPPSLVDPFLSIRRHVDVHPPLLEQRALTDFIAEGHFTRHLRRMRTLYAERRAALIEATLDLPLEIESPEAGIHCIGWLPAGQSGRAVARRARDADLDLSPLADYCLEPAEREGVLLGYGAYSAAEIRAAARRLASVLRA